MSENQSQVNSIHSTLLVTRPVPWALEEHDQPPYKRQCNADEATEYCSVVNIILPNIQCLALSDIDQVACPGLGMNAAT